MQTNHLTINFMKTYTTRLAQRINTSPRFEKVEARGGLPYKAILDDGTPIYFFIHGSTGDWHTTERTTGLGLANASTIKAVRDATYKLFENADPQSTKNMLEAAPKVPAGDFYLALN